MGRGKMEKQRKVKETTVLKWTAAGLGIVILLLVGVLAFLIREQTHGSDPPQGLPGEARSDEGTGASSRDGHDGSGATAADPDDSATGAVTVPGAHDGETIGEPISDSGTETDRENEPSTAVETKESTDTAAAGVETEAGEETSTEKPSIEPDIGGGGVLKTEMNVSSGLTFANNPDGSCTVTGMGDCTDSHLIIPPVSPDGHIVRAIAARAFSGNDRLITVFIPATVTEIGAEAFSGCIRLAFITAETGGTAYRTVNGVLFSLDMTRLLCYPPARQTDTLVLPDSLVCIEDGALRGAVGLREIVYHGTAEDFSGLSIGRGNNVLLLVDLIFRME